MRVVSSLFVLASLTSAAAAEPPGLTPEAAPRDTTVEVPSYRLQTALADGAVLMAAVALDKSNPCGSASVAVALGGYLLAAPIVHIAHDHSDRAAESFALRVALPLLGGFIGNAIGKSQCSYNCDNDADIALTALGVMTGAVAASAVDIGYLSRGETVTRSAPRWSPRIAAGPNGELRVGVGGTF
jgi:hypothetical protein